MRIVEVNESNLAEAGRVHALSWQESHRSICSAAFIAKHTPEAQAIYLEREMLAGKRVYMLLDPEAVGIVSIQESLIENLYVLPSEQRKGYGMRLLHFAMAQCTSRPTLWILHTNDAARRLYIRHGFSETGRYKQLSSELFEVELAADNYLQVPLFIGNDDVEIANNDS